MKKFIAVVLLMVMAVVCVACTSNKSAQAPETKLYSYTIVNETGKEISNVSIADDKSPNKSEIKYQDTKMENGAKVGLSVSAVPDKDGNPSLTASYTIGDSQYMVKVTSAAAEIKLTAEGQESGAFQVTTPQK